VRILLVSSFVLPHAGGVEQFVDTIRRLLLERGCEVRVLACRLPGQPAAADATVPARMLGPVGWPLPVGGARTLWREVGWADAVVANVSLYPLPALSVLAARRRRVPALFVIHGSGAAGGRPGGGAQQALRTVFRHALARPAVRRSMPVSVSIAGLDGIERLHGVRGRYLPYPLRPLPPAEPQAPGEPLRVVWVGRLAAEKDPLAAVRAVERLRETTPAVLDLYGEGGLRARLEALAASRPWLTLRGARPWEEVLRAQATAHVCLSTSVWDNVQVAVLEALARGIPVVSTRVGDAPRYYGDPELAGCCCAPGDAGAQAEALRRLAERYAPLRAAFAANGARLTELHGRSAAVLMQLIDEARGRRAAG
jgi:glycosyltransferase involved in cell wall biosynthesis